MPRYAKLTMVSTKSNSNLSTNSSTSSSSSTKKLIKSEPILQFRARNTNPTKCPFENSSVSLTLFPSSCLHLTGQSGAGKTTLVSYITGLLPNRGGDEGAKKLLRNTLGIEVEQCTWDEKISKGERVGMLFQQTTLLDSLTVAGNVCVALEHCPSAKNNQNGVNANNINDAMQSKRAIIKRLLETVGLDYLRDGPKRPSQLSGGMARRASLALQLAQHKHVIVLDEPFAGLDYETAVGIAKELERLRRVRGTALLLISHEPEIVRVVMGEDDGSGLSSQHSQHSSWVNGNGSIQDIQNGTRHFKSAESTQHENSIVHLSRRDSVEDPSTYTKSFTIQHPSLHGKDAHERFTTKLLDYFLYSLPLILLTFLAAGLAISMLSSDILKRVDVTEPVLAIVEKEVKPIVQMFTGAESEEDVNPLYTLMINAKVRNMLDNTIPPAKASLYAMGMTKLFVLEIGPLITALLLSGRIGGSYAGEVSTMQATAQNKLLLTLGISPIMWTFVPSLLASWIAAPLLTLAGTILALEIGAHVGPWYGIGTVGGYREEVWEGVFVPLRLQGVVSWVENINGGVGMINVSNLMNLLDIRTTHSTSYNTYTATLIEITTHPIVFHFIKSLAFISIIMGVAEVASRRKADLTPRGVPKVITTSVVMGSLLVIFADWGFSQLLLKRY